MKTKILAASTFLTLILFANVIQAQDIIGYSPIFIFDTKEPQVTILSPKNNSLHTTTIPLEVTWLATDDNLSTNPISIRLKTFPGNNEYIIGQNMSNTGYATINIPQTGSIGAQLIIAAEDSFGNTGDYTSTIYFIDNRVSLKISPALFPNVGNSRYGNIPQNIMLLKLEVQNNSQLVLRDILFEAFLGEVECTIDLMDFDANNDGLLDMEP